MMSSPDHRFLQCLGVFALAATLAAALAGCGGPALHQVKGKVLQKDGKPLAGGYLVFQPVDDKAGATADSAIGEDGTFELRTKTPGDGVVPGKYKAMITPSSGSEDEKPKGPPPVHPDFQLFETTPLEYEVKPGSNDFTIKVYPATRIRVSE